MKLYENLNMESTHSILNNVKTNKIKLQNVTRALMHHRADDYPLRIYVRDAGYHTNDF